jgi:hypothetical protein
MAGVYVKSHRRGRGVVRAYKRGNSHLARANRMLGLSNRLTRSAMNRGVSKFSSKRLMQIDSTIQRLNRGGYDSVQQVMNKKAALQKILKKPNYGLGYRLPRG